MNLKKVFISAFKFMKEQVWYYLKKLKLHNTVKTIQDIQWIITVPAIWDDIAKLRADFAFFRHSEIIDMFLLHVHNINIVQK